ncbi:MAG: hypothetical protein AB7J32_08105 [Pseudonocardia sp.]
MSGPVRRSGRAGLAAGRWQAGILLVLAVVLAPALTIAAWRVPAGVLRGVPGFGTVVPVRPWWPVAVAVVGALIAAVLLCRRRRQPSGWPESAYWSGASGVVAILGSSAGITEATGGGPGTVALLAVLSAGAPGLLVRVSRRRAEGGLARGAAAARAAGASPSAAPAPRTTAAPRAPERSRRGTRKASGAGKPAVSSVSLRGGHWKLWLGEKALVLVPLRSRAGGRPVRLPWSQVAEVRPGRVDTPLARFRVAPGVEAEYTMGEVVLVRGRGGEQWVLPVDSAQDVATALEHVRWTLRAAPPVDESPPEQPARTGYYRPVTPRTVRRVLGGPLAFAVGALGLWRVATGQDGPVALLGVAFFWIPCIVYGLLVVGSWSSRVRARRRPVDTPTWTTVPGWEPL